METRVYSALKSVRRRQRWQAAVHGAAWGLLGSAGAGTALGVWKWLADQPPPVAAAVAVFLSGPLLGAIAGLLWRRSWQAAAVAVDRHYVLKDRSLTALEFLRQSDASPLHRLQVDDAVEHLGYIDAKRVVPLRVPRIFGYGLMMLLVAVALTVWPTGSAEVQAKSTEPLEGVLTVAEEIEKDLDEMEETAEKEKSQELKELVEQLREEVDEMKQPGVELRDALARISEMQQSIAAQQAEYNTTLVDAQLNSLGSAMMAAESLQGAAQKLQKGDYDKAAEELENLENADFSPREARTASERMKKAAREMQNSGLGQLSQCTSQMADGIKSGQTSKMCRGARKLAGLCRKQGLRKRLSLCLGSKLAKLSQCKSMCRGLCMGESSVAKKSDSPSQKAGKAASNQPFGEKTALNSSGPRLELTGTPGEGPSTVEVTNSPEGRQQAQRSYKEAYREYRKRSEAVLESEPIPLGHRQTIRRYFELIRPQGEDAVEVEGEE